MKKEMFSIVKKQKYLVLWFKTFAKTFIYYAKCRNLPIGGRATWGSRVRLPRKENARSCHQRLFEEKIRKNQKQVYEL